MAQPLSWQGRKGILHAGTLGPEVQSVVHNYKQIGLNPDERALTFASVEDCDRALELIWDEKSPVFRLPYDHGNRLTLIVPAPSLSAFRDAGLNFSESRVETPLAATNESGQPLLEEVFGPRPGLWRESLELYREKKALTFETVEDCDRALELIWDEKSPAYRLPYDHGDRLTLVIPADAESHFSELGLRYSQQSVRTVL